jgi:hypothetical protein
MGHLRQGSWSLRGGLDRRGFLGSQSNWVHEKKCTDEKKGHGVRLDYIA